jgi:hypothetical protein
MQPHLHQTRDQANSSPVVLLVQDTTAIDLSASSQDQRRGAHRQRTRTGIFRANGAGRASADPRGARVHGPGTPRAHSRSKGENSGINGASGKSAKAMFGCARCKPLARAPPTSMWVHVGDRGADRFPFLQACHVTQTHFLVRAAQKRHVQESEEESTYALDRARSWPSQGSRVLELPARHGHPGRPAQLQLSFGQLTLLPPRASKEPLTVWVMRVWEE